VLIDDLLRDSRERAHESRTAHARPLRRFQRHAQGRGQDEFLPARPELVEPHDSGGIRSAGDGEPRRARSLRGKVQCIYLDPPYGIKFNSNFQWSTTSRDVKDGKRRPHYSRAEQVESFRDTWRDGITATLLTCATGSPSPEICSPIRVRSLCRSAMRTCIAYGRCGRVFGEKNFVSLITLEKSRVRQAIFFPTYSILFFGSVRTLAARNSGACCSLNTSELRGTTGYTFAENTETFAIRTLSKEELADPSTISSQR